MRADAANLDLLRSIAVLTVVFSHAAPGMGWDWDSAYHLSGLGLLGVCVFFVHTSLVLMMSLSRDATEHRAVGFWVRRALRIYPLSIVVVSVCTLAAAKAPPFQTVVSNLLLVQNITGTDSVPLPLWSLPFEVQMYAVLPALYLVTLKSRPTLRVAAIWVGAVAAVLAAWRLQLNYHLIKFVPCFLSGVLAFVLMRSAPATWPPRVLFAAVLLIVLAYPVAVARGWSETVLAWPASLLLGFLMARCRDVTNAPLAHAAKIVATYSYGIYLWHGPALHFAFEVLPGPAIGKVLFAAASTAVLSFTSYRLVERPGIQLGRQLAAHIGRIRAPLRPAR